MWFSELGFREASVILSLIVVSPRREDRRSKYWSPEDESKLRTLSKI
jgi:hypothetical protein